MPLGSRRQASDPGGIPPDPNICVATGPGFIERLDIKVTIKSIRNSQMRLMRLLVGMAWRLCTPDPCRAACAPRFHSRFIGSHGPASRLERITLINDQLSHFQAEILG